MAVENDINKYAHGPQCAKWYHPGMEVSMIELTDQQLQALEHAQTIPPRIVNPRTKETFVLLRVEEYEHL